MVSNQRLGQPLLATISISFMAAHISASKVVLKPMLKEKTPKNRLSQFTKKSATTGKTRAPPHSSISITFKPQPRGRKPNYLLNLARLSRMDINRELFDNTKIIFGIRKCSSR